MVFRFICRDGENNKSSEKTKNINIPLNGRQKVPDRHFCHFCLPGAFYTAPDGTKKALRKKVLLFFFVYAILIVGDLDEEKRNRTFSE